MQMLQALDAAARHGNYSSAADELGLTHGAISHQIRDMEQRLGVSLFHRSGRSMLPTREATTLLALVRQALGVLHHAFPVKSASFSRVVLGIHPSLATCWLLPRIATFLHANPEIDVEIKSTADLGDFLASGIDFAIRYGLGTWPNTASEHVGDETLFPVCSPQYRDLMRLTEPGDLMQCKLLRHAWQPWAPWLRTARVALREPTDGLVVSDSAMLVEAAAAGLGVALVRERFAENALLEKRLVRPFRITIADTNGYYLVRRTGDAANASAQLLQDWIRSEMQRQICA